MRKRYVSPRSFVFALIGGILGIASIGSCILSEKIEDPHTSAPVNPSFLILAGVLFLASICSFVAAALTKRRPT